MTPFKNPFLPTWRGFYRVPLFSLPAGALCNNDLGHSGTGSFDCRPMLPPCIAVFQTFLFRTFPGVVSCNQHTPCESSYKLEIFNFNFNSRYWLKLKQLVKRHKTEDKDSE